MVSQPSHMISVCFTTPSFRLPVLSLDATTQGKSSLSSTDEGRCLCSHFITLWHFYILYYSCLHTCLNLWIDCKGQGHICSDFLLSCILGLLWHQTASRNQNPFQLFLKKKPQTLVVYVLYMSNHFSPSPLWPLFFYVPKILTELFCQWLGISLEIQRFPLTWTIFIALINF